MNLSYPYETLMLKDFYMFDIEHLLKVHKPTNNLGYIIKFDENSRHIKNVLKRFCEYFNIKFKESDDSLSMYGIARDIVSILCFLKGLISVIPETNINGSAEVFTLYKLGVTSSSYFPSVIDELKKRHEMTEEEIKRSLSEMNQSMRFEFMEKALTEIWGREVVAHIRRMVKNELRNNRIMQ